ncbi:putative endonuclease [Lachnellula willkommii]|uniref:Probable endonuclease LCL3 n=1 Tax=Lachnellula willkommii TaxID=215461 RepID=A0A559MNF5_9HELO|nr:putative endonuclease [Lachnellula willkommii]
MAEASSHIDDQAFHDFPPAEALTGPKVEGHLRELGFGYRAGYIAKTAKIVAKEKPEGWLESLCNHSHDPDQKPPQGGREGYRTAHEELLHLQGVGPKVADCVCLMGLGWGEAVPVDTHVWQIAQRDYKFGKGKHKSLTKTTYDAVGDYFRQLWGIEAGWAHSVLFAADLKTFSERLTTKVEVDIDEVKIKKEDGNIHIRIAGIDAPEGAHFGKPAQPYSEEALLWLRNYILNRRVRAYIYKRDQYERVVATVWVRRFLFRRDVGKEMLKAGLATIYEAKIGAEFGNFEKTYRKTEEVARKKKLGMWAGKLKDYESPRDYKIRTAAINEQK